MNIIAIAALALAMGGCVTPRPAIDACRAASGNKLIGTTASQESAMRLMRLTHTHKIRWIPPWVKIVTTSYTYGQLTVAYDEAMKIIDISCG